jgi:hypothetical protein
MGRRLHSLDHQGRLHRERGAEKRKEPAGTSWTGRVLLILAVLAAVIVIASVL